MNDLTQFFAHGLYGPMEVKDLDHLKDEFGKYIGRQSMKTLCTPTPLPARGFGHYVEALRRRRHLTRRQAAQAAGLPPVYYSLIEMGELKEVIPMDVVLNIAEALRVPPEEWAISPWDDLPLDEHLPKPENEEPPLSDEEVAGLIDLLKRRREKQQNEGS